MLYIVAHHPETEDFQAREREYIWHLNREVPKMSASEVMEIQADGHELELIERNCTNLPSHKGPVVSWYGDLARFIYTNLHRLGRLNIKE